MGRKNTKMENNVMEMELDREWFVQLKSYLNQMPVERQNTIKEMAYRTVQC